MINNDSPNYDLHRKRQFVLCKMTYVFFLLPIVLIFTSHAWVLWQNFFKKSSWVFAIFFPLLYPFYSIKYFKDAWKPFSLYIISVVMFFSAFGANGYWPVRHCGGKFTPLTPEELGARSVSSGCIAIKKQIRLYNAASYHEGKNGSLDDIYYPVMSSKSEFYKKLKSLIKKYGKLSEVPYRDLPEAKEAAFVVQSRRFENTDELNWVPAAVIDQNLTGIILGRASQASGKFLEAINREYPEMDFSKALWLKEIDFVGYKPAGLYIWIASLALLPFAAFFFFKFSTKTEEPEILLQAQNKPQKTARKSAVKSPDKRQNKSLGKNSGKSQSLSTSKNQKQIKSKSKVVKKSKTAGKAKKQK